MDEFKFTWNIVKGNKTYTREQDKDLEKFLSLRPFLFIVIEKQTKKEFHYLIDKNRTPIFFRRVFGKCGLNVMINKILKVVNCFGYEEDGKRNVFWENNNKFYSVQDIDKFITLENMHGSTS